MQRIAIIKSESLLEYNKAIEILIESEKLILNEISKGNKEFLELYVFNIYYLADTYKAFKNYDKCSFYNNLGLLKSNEYKVFYMKNYFILCEGSNLIFKKNYNKAINNLSKILPTIKDEPNKLAINYYLGKAYQGLKNTDKALLYFKKVDSIDIIHKVVSPEFVDGYHFLINYYIFP